MPSLTSNHWGIGVVETKGGKVSAVRGHPLDPNPSRLNDNIAGGLGGRARVLRPAVRATWLNGETGERGRDPFVEVDWNNALDLVSKSLKQTISQHGNSAIFAGSYGWASAGRFHHAQSQLKRFLNHMGGFTGSEGNYSCNAALMALPQIVGGSFIEHITEATRWPVIAQHSDLVVLFGGLPMRNTQISDGGASRHRMADNLELCRKTGVRFVSFSPLKNDVDPGLDAEWLTPGTIPTTPIGTRGTGAATPIC